MNNDLLLAADCSLLPAVVLSATVTLKSREEEQKDEDPGEAQSLSHDHRARPGTLIRHCPAASHRDLPKNTAGRRCTLA